MTDKPVNPILIRVPMPIETPRLILRGVETGDGAAMHDAKMETLKDLQRWMPWAKEPGTVEDTEIGVTQSHARFLLREDLMILGFEKAGGKLVLSTGFHRMNWDLRIFEVGYWVRKSAQNKGYATESTAALIRYAFNALAATKIRIAHDSGNDASERVIRKLGFQEEAVLKKQGDLPDGTVVDHHWYARFDTNGLPDFEMKW